jgi:hypothetical protein
VSRLLDAEIDFLNSLSFEDLRQDYLKEKEAILAKLHEEIASEMAQKTQELRDEIQIDREHRKILNACVYPFASKVSSVRGLGYRFLRAAPLLEKNVGNLDFLVYKRGSQSGGVAIFGEAKGTISDPRSAVKQTVDREQIVMENAGYCKSTYLGGESSEFEFVLGVSSVDSNNVAKAVVHRGGGLIIWHSERSANPELTIHVPHEDNVRKSMIHSDDKLNHELGRKVPTSLEFKTFYLQSHVVSKLLVLIGIDRRSPDGTFAKEDLIKVVETELNYIDDPATILRETEIILSTGIQIDFVDSLGQGHYKIRSRYKNSVSREADLIDKWVDNRMTELTKKREEEALKPLQEKYRHLRSSRPSLEVYFP